MLNISLFCGGRGCASIIREILQVPDVKLNLLVNAYDNGESTGALRRFIPGYLGPSDFRKNLSYLLELYSPEQYMLSKLINYRLPADFYGDAVNDFIAYIHDSTGVENVSLGLLDQLQAVKGELKESICMYLKCFFAYYLKNKDKSYDFRNCSLGNLILAGAFIKNNNDFEMATRELMASFRSKTNANLINISNGENRFLTALKEDGEFLEDEAKIVGKQSSCKYSEIYLIAEQFTKEDIDYINKLEFREKKRFMEGKDKEVSLSDTAKNAIENCDMIIYGPGTQFSSLYPSYKTKEIGQVIAHSKAKIKVFIVNINRDNDIASYTAEDLVDTALYYLGDKENDNIITHVLYNKESNFCKEGMKLRGNFATGDNKYKNIEILLGDYEHPNYPGLHSGTKTTNALLDLYEYKKKVIENEIDIYVDLNERSVAVNVMIEEFLEIDWCKHFKTVRLYINNVKLPTLKLPSSIEIYATENKGFFSEVDVFYDWFWGKKSKYLVTVTGDGEYKLNDIIHSINILNNTTFGAVYGSRNQSRQQFINSLNAAYGESRFLFYLSRFGAFFLGVLCALRFKIVFSDPLSGFRVYSGRILRKNLNVLNPKIKLRTSVGLTHYIVRDKIEIAEIPVRYRTFKGFTNVKWRFFRGIRNLIGVFC
tara:strand:+ start:885 stop:2840 length:1956 start_codon:yes stop_codon:yes gene_type:complete